MTIPSKAQHDARAENNVIRSIAAVRVAMTQAGMPIDDRLLNEFRHVHAVIQLRRDKRKLFKK